MEKLILTSATLENAQEYLNTGPLMRYEQDILREIITAIGAQDAATLEYLNSFGDDFRHITMNLHAYRKGLEFGFTDIAFDQYGWFKRPVFLDAEDIKFGDSDRYGEYSIIHIGRGPGQVWTYALNYSYGTAGGGSALSVYDKKFPDRDTALKTGLADLKARMLHKVGDTDTTNYKQTVISATLKAISALEISFVQLSLF